MDTIKSFKGYGKVDATEHQAFQKNTRRTLVLIGLSTVVIGVVVGAAVHVNRSSDSGASITMPTQSLKAVCSLTQYPDACLSSLSNFATADPAKLFFLSLQAAMDELSKLVPVPAAHISRVTTGKANADLVQKALESCAQVFSDSVDHLNDSISLTAGKLLSSATIGNLRTWLSTALTDQDTCLDGLEEINGTAEIVAEIRSEINRSAELVSNSLAIVTKLCEIVPDFKIPVNGGVLEIGFERFPDWVGAAERRLLQETMPTPAPDAVVAKDGSGKYSTIAAAVAEAPVRSEKRYVIYVKEGKYVENVVVPKKVWNLMIYGDGMTKTVVSGSLNFVDGIPTFKTATFVAQGKGFMAKDIGFENTAGPAKHQAVAFRSGSDKSLFHRCNFDGYQDTLYPHSNRQFYLQSTVTGTVDFIFGNAAAVFQNCTVQPRQPLPRQFNTVTAQGKRDPNQNTGISIQKCNFTPRGTLTAPTFLGRPWKEYSTTVVMQSNIGPFLSPLGWSEWTRGVEPPSTIFYGEYENSGPGADVSKRVKWAGYQPTMSVEMASKYTVDTFIDGSSWLGDVDITYDPYL